MKRPFKSVVQIGSSGVTRPESVRRAPNGMERLPAKRDFKQLAHVGPTVMPWVTHRLYDAGGGELWRADHGHRVYGIATDSLGNVYTCGGDVNFVRHPRTSTSIQEWRLAKWDRNGNLKWRIDSDTGIPTFPGSDFTFTVKAWDVTVDPDDNVWIALGTTVEKYSPDGDLLLTRGIETSNPTIENIRRIRVSSTGLVIMGSDSMRFNNASASPQPRFGGQTCDLDGTFIGTFWPPVMAHPMTFQTGELYHDYQSRFDFDEDGNFYSGIWGEQLNPGPFWAGSSFYGQQIIGNSPTAVPLAPFNLHNPEGYHQGLVYTDEWPNMRGVGAVAVHRPSGEVLYSWGVQGLDTIRNAGVITPVGSLPYLNDRPDLVTETGACHASILYVNDNKRYVYGLPYSGGSLPTHRVRDYPNTLVFQASHKATIHDAKILADNRVLICGNRVYDPA